MPKNTYKPFDLDFNRTLELFKFIKKVDKIDFLRICS